MAVLNASFGCCSSAFNRAASPTDALRIDLVASLSSNMRRSLLRIESSSVLLELGRRYNVARSTPLSLIFNRKSKLQQLHTLHSSSRYDLQYSLCVKASDESGWLDRDAKLQEHKLPQHQTERPILGVGHEIGDVVGGQYTIVGLLGQGGVGTTYEAKANNGEHVAVKAMSLRSMKGWKDLDMFEREAQMLRLLNHPGIPQYIDYFQEDSSTDRHFYLVQKIAVGSSLAAIVDDGYRFTEAEVVNIALEVLEVLQYLQSLRPPVIHRDIKPENLILDKATGRIKVVDFGAVQDIAAASFPVTTVVGTFWYMAPEQFQRRALPQSDLYSLGGTLLFLLSGGQAPSSFPQRRLRVDFRPSVSMSSAMADVVEGLLEPATEDRFQIPADVKLALQNVGHVASAGNVQRAPSQGGRGQSQAPAGTKVVVVRSGEELRVSVPPMGITAESVGTGSFAIAWNSMNVMWTTTAIRSGAPWFFTAFSLPFWAIGFGLARMAIANLGVSVDISMTRSSFEMEWKLGSLWSHRVSGHTSDLQSAHVVVVGTQNTYQDKVMTACELTHGVKQHRFGGGLQVIEQEWIIREISDFLGLPPPEPVSRTVEKLKLAPRPSSWSSSHRW